MGPTDSSRVRTSIRVLQIVMLGFSMVVLGRLFQLQILQFETYNPLSRENAIRQEYVHPARGLIYDRYGNLLVDNEPIYTITITPANFKAENIPLLANLVGMPIKKMRERVEKAQAYSWHRSSRLLTEVDFEVFSLIQENIWRLPGIGHQIESKRNYPTPISASHILGYLREVSEKEYRQKESYRLGDKVGKSGLEQVYEDYMRGEMGTEYLRINAMGQTMGPYENGKLDEPPEKGDDLLTTLDTELQILSEKLMEDKIGAVVAMNPNNGAILSMVSSPQYNIRRLSGRIDTEYWKSINADTTTPLFNRALTSQQPPGSTFKPLMALVGLELGVITPETTVNCTGAYYKGRAYKCTKAHGKQKLEQAIQNSCNTYFFSLMNKIAMETGIDRWHELITSLGLGQKNYVDLPYETSGIIPDSTYLDNVLGAGKWGIGDVINLGVGQGFVSVSPLQMALAASEIGNGGHWIQPHVVRGIRRNDGTIDRMNPGKRKIKWVDKKNLELVKNGMRKVVTDGSGRWYANPNNIEMAGKTGTAQNPHGRDHAWFITFAPKDNPQIAVAVLVENAGFGSLSAAPIASLIVEKYLTGKIERQWIYKRMLNFDPRDQEKEDT